MQSLYTSFSFLLSRLSRFVRPRLCHSLVPQQNNSSASSKPFFQPQTLVFAVAISALLLTSCEKVIDLNLNSAEKKYVIEAVVTDQPGSAKVLLSQTKDFDDNNSFNGISGAEITINDNNGTTAILTEKSAGVYEAPNFIGVSGGTYNLTVKVGGETFTATSKMPQLVAFDSLYISERTFFDETYKYATLQYTDPPGKGNAYRYIQYVNGVKEKTIFARDDDLNDGRKIERVLVFYSDDDDDEDEKKLKRGDIVTVEMLCIDYPVFKYWYGLNQSATGQGQSASPANPVTNMQGGALGYFSAHTIRSRSIVVE